jgi:methyl-accepting chemotaxis protein
MKSLKHQLAFMIISPVLVLAVTLTIVIGVYLKDRALLATTTKARSDLATGEQIVELMYPGNWHVRDGILYKGETKINNNFSSVDKIASLTGDTVTIFLNDKRVTTTVREKNGERAIGTKVSEQVANSVLKNGNVYVGEANVLEELYHTAYKPLRDRSGNIVGMFYVGVSKTFSDELIRDSIATMGIISFTITILVAIGAYIVSKRIIINPLAQLTEETRAVVFGKKYKKVDTIPPNEIGDLVLAMNNMMDGMQKLANQMNVTKVTIPEEIEKQTIEETAKTAPKISAMESTLNNTELPKGLNMSTLRQIINYINNNRSMSAEEVGEGVKLTRVTARRYLEYLEQNGFVAVELKYGTIGRPVKLYSSLENTKSDDDKVNFVLKK